MPGCRKTMLVHQEGPRVHTSHSTRQQLSPHSACIWRVRTRRCTPVVPQVLPELLRCRGRLAKLELQADDLHADMSRASMAAVDG